MANNRLIYMATSKTSGKSYIGYTTRGLLRRMGGHESDAHTKRFTSLFHRAIRKYGFDDFEWTVLHEDIGTDELLQVAEMCAIYVHETRAPMGYNLTDGGDGCLGFRHTEEGLRKMRGRKFSEEHKDKLKGEFSKEHRDNLSKAKLGHIPWNRGKRGGTWSPARRAAHEAKKNEQ